MVRQVLQTEKSDLRCSSWNTLFTYSEHILSSNADQAVLEHLWAKDFRHLSVFLRCRSSEAGQMGESLEHSLGRLAEGGSWGFVGRGLAGEDKVLVTGLERFGVLRQEVGEESTDVRRGHGG